MRISKIKTKAYVTAFLFYAMILLGNQATFAQYVCQRTGSPVVQSGSLTAGDPTQTGRVNRNGIPSSCNGKVNAIFNSTQVLARDDYTYTAPVTGCARVTFDARQCGGATTQAVAYSSYNPTSPGNNTIGDFGFSTTSVATFGFPVTQGQNFTIVIHDILESPTNILCTNYTFTIDYNTSCQQPGFDRNNDGAADAAVFTPGAQGTFTNTNLMNNATETRPFGQTGDVPVPADYNGDGLTELAVYRPSNNFFYSAIGQTNTMTSFTGFPYGTTGDLFVPGDYDGDTIADVAVWRPSNGFWYALQSSNNTLLSVAWGQNGDTPVTGDFDGDLKTDFAVVRPNVGGAGSPLTWFILQSNFSNGFALAARWGANGDIPVVGDYDGNGKADISVFRPSSGLWGSLLSNASNTQGTTQRFTTFGQMGDIPQPADYDGDGTTDVGVFRPDATTSAFYARNSSNSMVQAIGIGTQTSVPVSAPYPIR